MLSRGGKAHSWDAAAIRGSGGRSSATRSTDVRASIEPQVSSILELQSPQVQHHQRDSEGSPGAPSLLAEAAARLSERAPSIGRQGTAFPTRSFSSLKVPAKPAIAQEDIGPGVEHCGRAGDSQRGTPAGGADIIAHSALYAPAKLKDDRQ